MADEFCLENGKDKTKSKLKKISSKEKINILNKIWLKGLWIMDFLNYDRLEFIFVYLFYLIQMLKAVRYTFSIINFRMSHQISPLDATLN